MTLTRSQLTNALLALPPQQIADLMVFERFKKWTCELFALAHSVNYSTANRRLHKLMKAGVLMVKVGQPLASGGREPDLYFPTQTGARMLTRLCDRQKNTVTMADTVNPIDNVHDLAALETAIRSECFDGARAFQERKFIWQGRAYSVIPDVEFTSPDGKDHVFVEVEQTSRPDHIAGKYEKYLRFFDTIGRAHSWLVVMFPDRRTEKLLRREHESAAAAAATAMQNDYNLYRAVLSEMRDKHVVTYESPMERDGGGAWHQTGTGFLDCTFSLLSW